MRFIPMSALEAVYICLYFLRAPLVTVVFTVEKSPEPMKNFATSDGLGGCAGEGGTGGKDGKQG